MDTSQRTPSTVLKKYWGYTAFRPLQEEIIRSVMAGEDTLALLPTGGGKSVCYQLPALLLEGVCVVISPLVALMKDQVRQLKARGIAAEAVYAGMSKRDIDRILDNCVFGKVRLLYCAPERLKSHMAEERIKRMQVSFVAVDEAHCVSQWGHDFRPSYLDIPVIREWHPGIPFLALTATATPAVKKDIAACLELRNHKLFAGSFARRNLSFLVYRREDKFGRLMQIVKRVPGTKLIYVRSRMKARELAIEVSRRGVRAEAYHAGMAHTERNAVQSRWLNDKVEIVVCTTAFGMGIDKPDVRLVVHYELPQSLEEYYQEAGRAGRDGEEAFCVTLYNAADLRKMEEMTEKAHPGLDDVKRVYQALAMYFQLPVGGGAGTSHAISLAQFCKRYQLDVVTAYRCLKVLEQDGWISLNEAFHHPARVRFLLGKDDLYRYQLDVPAHDPLIKVLLRNYEGLFLEPVAINEARVAEALKKDKQALSAMLVQMEKKQVITYQPASDQPQVTFLQPRPAEQNFTIDEERVTRLRAQAVDRMHAVRDYLDTQECRERMILAYFGEKQEEICGKCDICRTSQGRVSTRDLLDRVKEEGTAVKELIAAFPANRHEAVRAELKSLEDERKISIVDDVIRIRKPEST